MRMPGGGHWLGCAGVLAAEEDAVAGQIDACAGVGAEGGVFAEGDGGLDGGGPSDAHAVLQDGAGVNGGVLANAEVPIAPHTGVEVDLWADNGGSYEVCVGI